MYLPSLQRVGKYMLEQSDIQEEDEEDIALANFIENYKRKLIMKFPKKVTR